MQMYGYGKPRSLALLLAAALLLLKPIESRAFDDSGAVEVEQLFRRLGITKTGKAPPVEGEVYDLQGQKVNLSLFKGKVAFLTFWTTWCPSCEVEMPALQKIYVRYREQGLQILAVSIDEPAERVAKYFRAKGLTYTSLVDPRGQLARRFGVWSIPVTFILDRRGIILGRAVGPRHWDSSEGRKLIQLLLADQ